jgi:predicted ATPase with chaperone activity
MLNQYSNSIKPCTYAPSMVTKSQKRISGPMLDHMDIHIKVPRVDYEKLSSCAKFQHGGPKCVSHRCKLDETSESLVRAATSCCA